MGGVLLTSVPHSDPGDCDSRVGDTARGSGKDCTIIIQARKRSKGAKGQMAQKGKRRKRRIPPNPGKMEQPEAAVWIMEGLGHGELLKSRSARPDQTRSNRSITFSRKKIVVPFSELKGGPPALALPLRPSTPIRSDTVMYAVPQGVRRR